METKENCKHFSGNTYNKVLREFLRVRHENRIKEIYKKQRSVFKRTVLLAYLDIFLGVRWRSGGGSALRRRGIPKSSRADMPDACISCSFLIC